MNLDLIVFRWLNSWAGINEWLDAGIIFRAEWLGLWLGGALGVFIVLGKDKRRELRMVLQALLAVLVSRFFVTELIRYFYDRPRPFEILENIYQLLEHSPGGSFPSGHAAFFFALAMSVFFHRKIWGIIFFLGAISIGLSRVAAGLHWPSDILGGAIVGILTSILINFLVKKYKKPGSF